MPWVVKACQSSNGRYKSDDIKKFLLGRDCQLWIAVRRSQVLAACVTEVINYPRKRALSVLMLTGKERESWQHLYKENIEKWAKEIGCDLIESQARVGWERVFPDYKKTHVFLEKEI